MKVKEILIEKQIQFQEKGADYIVRCLNPEHNDTHPSLRIDKLSGKYNCFSCGFKGDLFRLFGLETPVVSNLLQETLKQINTMLIETKGLEIPESAEYFSTEFRGIKPSTYEQFKVFTHSEYDGRLCFPITNYLTGKITNIIGRTLYSNVSPKYLVYPFGGSVPLFPFVKAKQIILVEGIFDLLNLVDKGITNVVCTFGTKLLENNLSEKLMPYILTGTTSFVILFDNDEAGLKAEESLASKIAKENVLVYKASSFISSDKDPGSLSQIEVDNLKQQIDCLIS